jgi:DNA-binding winged helix-turn-helix (wHTH) protein
MILLIAAPSLSRTGLLSILKHERLSVHTCDTVADGLRAALTPPGFELVIVDHRLGPDEVREFTARFARQSLSIPFVIVGVPLRFESDLLRQGALAIFGAGYSPRTVALQCFNLKYFSSQRWEAPAQRVGGTVSDFPFGNAIVSPEARVLKRKSGTSTSAQPVPLSRTQFRLLEVFKTSPGRILTYEFLFHSIWNRPYRGRNGMIREAVSSLRERFSKLDLDLDCWVRTIYGEGYRFDPTRDMQV